MTSHYDCLDYHQLASLSVADLAAKHFALFLWAVDPVLDRAMDLIRAWGFTYETGGFYWVKLNPNANPTTHSSPASATGPAQTPNNACSPRVEARAAAPTTSNASSSNPRRQHSRKPDSIRTRIERLLDGPYLELFARSTKPGWGAEVGLFDSGHAPTRRQPLQTPNPDHAA